MRSIILSLLAAVSTQPAFAGVNKIGCLVLSNSRTVPIQSQGNSGPFGWETRTADINGYHVVLILDDTGYLARIDLPNDTQIVRSGKLQSIVSGGENVVVSLDRHGETLVSILCQPSR